MGLAAELCLHEARLYVSLDVGDSDPSHVVSSAVSVHPCTALVNSGRPGGQPLVFGAPFGASQIKHAQRIRHNVFEMHQYPN